MNILVPVDGSRFSNAAVAFIASRTTLIGRKPRVALLNVQPPIPAYPARILGQATVRAFHQKEADGVLRPASLKLTKKGLRVSSSYVVGNPAARVGEFAASHHTDLIVMGSHGHPAFKGLLFGSVTTAVLASCVTPVLIVRGRSAPASDSLRVGICIDRSHYGVAAVRYALKHRDLFGKAPVVWLINVVPDLRSNYISGFPDAPAPVYEPERIAELQACAFEAAMVPVRKLIRRSGVVTTEIRLIGNHPADEIVAFAKKSKLDVLVMGSHGHGALKSAVLGSVATRVAAKCQTPLLLIRA